MAIVVRTIGWIGLLVTLGLIVALITVFAQHPRDEPEYLLDVHRYGNPQHRVPAEDMPSDQVLVAVGDRACDWLARREPALWRRATVFQLATRASVYRASSGDTAPLLAAGLRPESVYLEAWANLCPGTQEIAEPHYQALHHRGGD